MSRARVADRPCAFRRFSEGFAPSLLLPRSFRRPPQPWGTGSKPEWYKPLAASSSSSRVAVWSSAWQDAQGPTVLDSRVK